MIRPLVMLKSSTCVMRGSYPRSWAARVGWAPDGRERKKRARGRSLSAGARRRGSARHRQLAAGLADRRRGLVASHDLIDIEEILGIVGALGLRRADEGRGHELMIAGAVVHLVRLQ